MPGLGNGGTGGSISFTTGTSSLTSSGSVIVQSRNAGVGGISGSLNFMTGTTSSGSSGSIRLNTGAATDGRGGNIVVSVKSGTATTGGDIIIGLWRYNCSHRRDDIDDFGTLAPQSRVEV